MIRRSNETKVAASENMRGGNGIVTLNHLLNGDEFYGKGRLFSIITVNPGDSIGYHVHENEMEVYYIISGSGTYDDNGLNASVGQGDVTITLDGEGHAIANSGDCPLVLAALILYK